MSGDSSIVQFSGTAGAQHVIERSTNLTFWSNLTTNAPPAHGVSWFTNNSPPRPAAFYRVRLQ
jgi:hypothetical protein